MRYYIKRDDKDKATAILRFNSDEIESGKATEIKEHFYNRKDKEWQDTDVVSTSLVFGEERIEEVSLSEAKKAFPEAF